MILESKCLNCNQIIPNALSQQQHYRETGHLDYFSEKGEFLKFQIQSSATEPEKEKGES